VDKLVALQGGALGMRAVLQERDLEELAAGEGFVYIGDAIRTGAPARRPIACSRPGASPLISRTRIFPTSLSQTSSTSPPASRLIDRHIAERDAALGRYAQEPERFLLPLCCRIRNAISMRWGS
jgi:hypothetical protein